MAKIIRLNPDEKSHIDKMVDALFQVLPALSHKDIAEKLTKYMKRPAPKRVVKEHEVGRVILHLRNNCEEYGWTVPHATRGRKLIEAKGVSYPFFAVLVERGRAPEFDKGHEKQLVNGLESTTQHAASSIAHESEAIILAAAYCKSPVLRQMLKSLGRRTKHISEDLLDVANMLKEENGG